MDRYSITGLMASMREALQAIAPVFERTGIRHRPSSETYDGWEDLEAQVFKSIIGEPIELAGADPMARYGFALESYAAQSFVSVAPTNTNVMAFVQFQSEVESFDSVLAAELHPDTLAVTGTAIVPFDKARFALRTSRYGVSQSFDYLSY